MTRSRICTPPPAAMRLPKGIEDNKLTITSVVQTRNEVWLAPPAVECAGPWSGALPMGLTNRRDHRLPCDRSPITFVACPANALPGVAFLLDW